MTTDDTPPLRRALDAVFDRADMSTPESRAAVAWRALDLIADLPDVLVRDQYMYDVCGRTRIDPVAARSALDKIIFDRITRA